MPQKTATRKQLASLREGSAASGVSEKTLRRYIADGRLPGYRFGPRLLKIDLDELEALARRIPTA